MDTSSILAIVSSVITVISIIFGYYVTIRKKIEKSALDAINSAEDTNKIGEEKFQEAVDSVYSIIPAVAKPFISKTLVETIIQTVFDKVEAYAKKQVTKK